MFSPLKSKPELGDTGPTQLIGWLQTRCWTPGTSLRDFYLQRHSLFDAYVLNQDADASPGAQSSGCQWRVGSVVLQP